MLALQQLSQSADNVKRYQLFSRISDGCNINILLAILVTGIIYSIYFITIYIRSVLVLDYKSKKE